MKGKIIEAAFVLAATIVLAFGFVSCQNTGGRSKEYVSGDGSFSITVSGTGEVYDQQIEAQRSAVSSLKEK